MDPDLAGGGCGRTGPGRRLGRVLGVDGVRGLAERDRRGLLLVRHGWLALAAARARGRGEEGWRGDGCQVSRRCGCFWLN
jgi:hypothetical protein